MYIYLYFCIIPKIFSTEILLIKAVGIGYINNKNLLRYNNFESTNFY